MTVVSRRCKLSVLIVLLKIALQHYDVTKKHHTKEKKKEALFGSGITRFLISYFIFPVTVVNKIYFQVKR